MKPNNTDTLVLDELDMMLARELELDARQTIVTLGKKLNTSQTTIKRRLQRLLDAEVITFVTISNMTSHLIGVNIGLNTESGKASEVAEHLRTYSNIKRVILTTGRYDIIISMLFHDLSRITDFIDEALSNIPCLTAAEKIIVMEATKTSWKYLNDDIDGYCQPPLREFDELDLKLMKELELAPRESIKDLGVKLGMNRQIVGRKLQSLLNDNVIQVVSIANPVFFGLNVPVFIFVKVRPGYVKAVASSLVSERRIHHICIITGPFDLFVNATFRDISELSDFLMNRMGNYKGIMSHETLLQVAFAKRSYSIV